MKSLIHRIQKAGLLFLFTLMFLPLAIAQPVWINVGSQESHGIRSTWLPNGYFITHIDLDGGNRYYAHDAPFIGRVKANNLVGVPWNTCQWIEVGPIKSHQQAYNWLPNGYYLTQIDLDGLREYSAHDSPTVGRVMACNLVGFTRWGDCRWIEITPFQSHQGSGEWCPPGYFMTQFDLDSDFNSTEFDSPVIGRIKCCKPER